MENVSSRSSGVMIAASIIVDPLASRIRLSTPVVGAPAVPRAADYEARGRRNESVGGWTRDGRSGGAARGGASGAKRPRDSRLRRGRCRIVEAGGASAAVADPQRGPSPHRKKMQAPLPI